ncbi:MAG: hypothetical protein MZV64_18250 [Ignavibacteriales bacterium]|nr:hypothetical protein [Ignavibacteriales bacterium]
MPARPARAPADPRRTGRGRPPLPGHARQLRLHARHQPGLHHGEGCRTSSSAWP